MEWHTQEVRETAEEEATKQKHAAAAKQKAAVVEMELYAAAGLNCFDLADHYGPAEDFVGAYVSSGAAERAPSPPFYLTKRVNFLHTLPHARPRSLPP